MQELTSPTLTAAPTHPTPQHGSQQRVVASAPQAILRVVTAIAFGVGVTYLVWRHIGTHLSVTTDIVGYPTFADFDTYRYIFRFYDITLVLPAATILAYLLLARFGPLRSSSSSRDWPPALEVTEPSASSVHGRIMATRLEHIDRTNRRNAFWALSRVGLTGLTVAVEASVLHSVHALTPTQFGIAAGVLYVIAVGGSTVVVGLRSRSARDGAGSMHDHGDGRDGWISRSFSRVLPVVNALASLVVIPLLVLVSSSTTVTVASDGRVVHYPWFPPWFGALATVVVAIVLARSLFRATSPAARKVVERRMLLVVVVPVLIFMVTAHLQGAQGLFGAFDDAQAMVGARLTFGHGLWPWRDVFLFHGFLYDDLYGAVGMWVLSPTRWGSNSGQSLFVLPFTLVALYGFIVYFARRNTLLIVAGALALTLGLFPAWGGTRYVLLPVVLILFDRVLRHGSWSRCLLFMASVVFFSVVTPEATLLMAGILVTLVFSEAIHRPRHQPFTEGFSRTARCAITGAAWIAVWSIFLAATGAFSGFVTYYQTAVAGHELQGAYSPHWSLTGDPWATIEFVLPIVLFLLTVWKVVAKLVNRSPWRPTEWVLVASSTPVLLFYQVVLDRMDPGHVTEVFQTLVPFVILWAMEVARLADSMVVRAWTSLNRRWSPTFRLRAAAPVTFVGILAIAVWSPMTPLSWTNAATAFHPVVPDAAPTQLPLGYTEPGAVPVTQITNLGKVLDRYAGKDGPVFDFTNEIGISYFLLNRVPGTRFYIVANAQTSQAQNLEVSDLRQSKPHVVLFNDVWFGIPDYDGIWSMERNYIVSQYILDHYRPLLDTHGQLVMLRNDLFREARPLSSLSQPPITRGLYFDLTLPACDWGDVPNFLIHPSSKAVYAGLNLPIHPGLAGNKTPIRTFSVTIPAGTDLSAYHWMVMQSSKTFGKSQIEVTDSFPSWPSHDIAFDTLPRTGNEVFTRVGSCLQWHGYHTPSLTVVVSGPAAPSSVHLLK